MEATTCLREHVVVIAQERDIPAAAMQADQDLENAPAVRPSVGVMTRAVLVLIRGYQMSFSKVLPPSCRYYPSCSHYTYEAVEKYGWLRGGWMGAVRIARCNPFARGGYDPVP